MYFAHHYGRFIRLAYADSIAGPWKIYEPGVLHIEHTAFKRAQPDAPTVRGAQRMHVASPDVHVDTQGSRILIWVHGWWTNNEPWPQTDPKSAKVATSGDGIHFEGEKPITRTSYLRVFRLENTYYGLERLGLLARSRQPFAEFELGPNPGKQSTSMPRLSGAAWRRLFSCSPVDASLSPSH